MTDDRRVFQRLQLSQPLDGWLGDYAVRLVDVSVTGAQVEHDEPIPDGRALLRFWWSGEEIEITSEVVRRDDGASGLRFIEENESLRRFIAASATAVLRAQEANAAGARDQNILQGDETLTAASFGAHAAGFLTLTYIDGVWKRKRSMLPDQPRDGFTIGAGEPEEQIEMLCRTYEGGDTEARRLTRLLAELSVASRVPAAEH